MADTIREHWRLLFFSPLTVIPCDEAVYIDFLENNLKTLSSLPTFPFCCYLLTINQDSRNRHRLQSDHISSIAESFSAVTAWTFSVGRDIPTPGAVKTTFFISLKLTLLI